MGPKPVLRLVRGIGQHQIDGGFGGGTAAGPQRAATCSKSLSLRSISSASPQTTPSVVSVAECNGLRAAADAAAALRRALNAQLDQANAVTVKQETAIKVGEALF